MCSAAACGFSTTSSFRSCSPSLMSTVTMFDWTIAGSLAQPSTLTVLAANGPPSCAASPRGTTNSANSMMTAIAPRRARRRIGQRLQVQRAQQVAVDQLERRARLARERQRRRLLPERRLQPVAPVVGAARRPHAAAAVVAQHDVVGREHDLVEERRHATAACRSSGTTSKTLPWRRNWAADPERNRSRISAAQRGQLLAHWLSRARASGVSGGGSVSRSSIAP